jgi:hypothetical protein
MRVLLIFASCPSPTNLPQAIDLVRQLNNRSRLDADSLNTIDVGATRIRFNAER